MKEGYKHDMNSKVYLDKEILPFLFCWIKPCFGVINNVLYTVNITVSICQYY